MFLQRFFFLSLTRSHIHICSFNCLFDGRTKKHDEKKKVDSSCCRLFYFLFVSVLVRTRSLLFWFDWVGRGKWHNSNEMNYRLFFFFVVVVLGYCDFFLCILIRVFFFSHLFFILANVIRFQKQLNSISIKIRVLFALKWQREYVIRTKHRYIGIEHDIR